MRGEPDPGPMQDGVSSTRVPSLDALTALLAARHSCRAFRPQSLPRATIQSIVQTAGRAPSWCNTQPWQLEITQGIGTERFRERMLREAENGEPRPDYPFPLSYTGENQQRRRECGVQLYEALGIDRADMEGRRAQHLRNFELFGAPHVAVVTSSRELGVYGAIDCGAFVAAFLLAAAAMGVATIPQAALAAYPDAIRQHFGLDNDRLVVCAISFGLEDVGHLANSFRTNRAMIDGVVTWYEG